MRWKLLTSNIDVVDSPRRCGEWDIFIGINPIPFDYHGKNRIICFRVNYVELLREEKKTLFSWQPIHIISVSLRRIASNAFQWGPNWQWPCNAICILSSLIIHSCWINWPRFISEYFWWLGRVGQARVGRSGLRRDGWNLDKSYILPYNHSLQPLAWSHCAHEAGSILFRIRPKTHANHLTFRPSTRAWV